jgi:hypothetical protein
MKKDAMLVMRGADNVEMQVALFKKKAAANAETAGLVEGQ